jgi:CBS domain-containing protein
VTAAAENHFSTDKVGNLASRCVLTVGEFQTLHDAVDLITQGRVSQLVVINDAMNPIGLVSKRNIARLLLEDGTLRSLEDFQVAEACDYSYHKVTSASPVTEVARLFDTENVSCAIVSENELISGILTETDLCRYFSSHSPSCMKVNDFMMKEFLHAKSTYPIIHVAHMIVNKQPSVPVIDENLVGILTLSDFLSIQDGRLDDCNKRTNGKKNDAALLPTKELMTRSPFTVLPCDDLIEAARIVINKQVCALPVVENDSEVVGLLTKHDIVRALGRTPDQTQVYSM